ncbi:winged helix-turn-helix transcriptional regulator [Mycobacterium sp.]|uniref:helix-turn-helix transcriptional regulator n=1 Tax=Mycobacterium sp. TaxID=1785 RepID=UPI0031E41CDE
MEDHTDRQRPRPQRHPRNRQRERVLEMVREQGDALDAAQLAARLGLHVTTVRFHLDRLCDEGAIERTRISRAGVGRPRTGYVAVPDRLDYQSLAEILALELGDTAEKRRRRAERAGRRWSGRLAAGSACEVGAGQDVSHSAGPSKTLEDRAAMAAKVFARMGFGPELTPAAKSAAGKRRRTIGLHACPVRELARAHPEVACAMHLGLLQGLLTNAAAAEGRSKKAPRPVMHAELEPFVEPQLCIARVISDD